MGNVMSKEEKEKWIEKTLKEKEKDPEYQRMLKEALKRQKERLLAISDLHQKGR